MTAITERRDWDFQHDGTLNGRYVEMRTVHIKSGPSAGQSKMIADFDVDGERVSVWLSAVLNRQFLDELRERRKGNFEPGERFTIERTGKKRSGSGAGSYWDYNVEFEHAAPKKSVFEQLLAVSKEDDEPDVPVVEPDISYEAAPIPAGDGTDDEIPF